MITIIIGSKSNFTEAEILEKKNKGSSYMEFHTIYNDFNGNIDFKYIRNYLDKINMTAYCVHTPMGNYLEGGAFSCCVGHTKNNYRKVNMDLFKKTIKAAHILCNVDKPKVVIHAPGYYKLDEKDYFYNDDINIQKNILIEDIKELSKFCLDNYPNVELCIENGVNFTIDKNESIISCHFFNEPILAEFINNLNLPNVKNILDICHALNTIRSKQINGYELKINDFIEKYKNNLGMIHLNNCLGFGDKTYNHSYFFDKNIQKDLQILFTIFKELKDVNYDNPVTLEINEEDYFNCVGYAKSLEAVKYVLNSLGYSFVY